MSKTVNFASLSAAELAVLEQQLNAVKKDRKDQITHTYAQSLEGMVTSVIEHETLAKSGKSDWVGYRVAGIPVTVEGHTFTVSVTITDTQAKADREQERKIAEARALVAAAEATASE